MEQEQIDELNNALSAGMATVTFTKADGSTRIMNCTKNVALIPADKLSTDANSARSENPDLIIAFDLDIQEWRSFKPSRVNSWGV